MARSDEYSPAPESTAALSSTPSPTHDDLDQLLSILPFTLRQPLNDHPQRHQLIEVILDLGRRPEARFPGQADYLAEQVVSSDEDVVAFGPAILKRVVRIVKALRDRHAALRPSDRMGVLFDDSPGSRR